MVKRAQQGKKLVVKMKDLTTESLDLLRKADYKGKAYPVLFESFAGKYVRYVVIN